MGVPEKLAQQASAQLGAAVLAASMVVPPGATLYRSYSPSSKVLGGGGAIGAAIASKVGDQASGMAGSVPRQMGVLAVTAEEVVFCKKKMLGVGCGARIAAWPREDVTMTFEAPEKWSYPGVLITFTDGSVCAVFAEKRWGLDALANAVNS